ncbi:AbrB family transcriptional regulator [Companilactobacillus mishanensis]|uniref:AbrB family transcriptional regulator n=1 Tax=Companilactobacillus mishanensis TaxID=2486008 RepID=A0A5P0ZI61_9LACO|nr:AbrB family transcriptional regulator [Companilactobacillus mishanensis]MQS52702.1 AbrB family transcriptional regulator [Companilactobacillus mishanensis]
MENDKSKKMTNLDWYNLVKDEPYEVVIFDKDGHYDPKKSPEFNDWMKNG